MHSSDQCTETAARRLKDEHTVIFERIFLRTLVLELFFGSIFLSLCVLDIMYACAESLVVRMSGVLVGEFNLASIGKGKWSHGHL